MARKRSSGGQGQKKKQAPLMAASAPVEPGQQLGPELLSTTYPIFREDFELSSSIPATLVDLGSVYSINTTAANAFTGNNSCILSGSTNHNLRSAVVDTLGGNITLSVYFRPVNGASWTMSIHGRSDSGDLVTITQGYRTDFNTTGLHIYKLSGTGTYAEISTATGVSGATITTGAAYLLELRLNGTAISARVVRQSDGFFWVNSGTTGTWQAAASSTSVTDSTFAAVAGYFSLRASTSPNSVYADDLIYGPSVASIDAGASFTLSTYGSTRQLTAGGFTDPLAGVTWSSSSPTVASVNSSGLVTALSNGTTTITATGVRDTGQTATSTATVSIPAASAYTIISPISTSGYPGNTSARYTVTPNGVYSGTITITPSGGGLSTPIVLTFSGSPVSQTFSITPTAAGTVTLTPTNSGSLTDLAVLTYTVGSPGWYSGSWGYRLPVTVDNTANSGNTLSYYQVPISITGAAYTSFAAHAKADGSDLRVADSDGVTLLGHALEWIDTTNHGVYLLAKVPTIAAAGKHTIYLYYGNAAASSVSSYTTTIGPTTAGTAADVYSQSDTAGYVNSEGMIQLKYQVGANASHNGDILIFASVGAQGDQFSQCKLVLIRCPAGSDPAVLANWIKSSLLNPADSSHDVAFRAACECVDGSIVLIYGHDTNANTLAGTAAIWTARSTDAGVTWTNLSTTASNPMPRPWGTTNSGTYYVRVIQDSGGNYLAPGYGKVNNTRLTSYLLACPAGSDPTNGGNWSVRGTIFNGVVDSRDYSETDILNTSGSNWIAIGRTHTTPWDLRRATSADNGATWTAATSVILPAASGSVNNPVSPWLLGLASGNILLGYGARQGSARWGSAFALSNDGGVTFHDRPASGLMLHPAAQNSSDWGYPTVIQIPDGRILAAGYHAVGSFLTNLELMVATEDYIVNSNNIVETCDSFDAIFVSHGVQCTIDTTIKMSGSGSLKIDNNSGTPASDYNAAFLSLWPTGTDGNAAFKVAYTYWIYITANAAVGQNIGDTLRDNAAVSRANVAFKDTNNAVEWYNGSAYQVSGTNLAFSQWSKISNVTNVQPASVTGRILVNNTDIGVTQGQLTAGTNPQALRLAAGAATSQNNAVANYDLVYSHQYTANVPTSSIASEQPVAATTYTFTGPASGYANNASGLFTVTPNNIYTGTITLTPTAGFGVVPIILTFSNSAAPQTFTITPTSAGTVTLTPTNSGNLTNPTTITYMSLAQLVAVSPTTASASTSTPVTFTGTGTLWTTSSPTFTPSGVAGCSITGLSIISNTQANATLITGSATGTLTITDSSSGATCTFAVTGVAGATTYTLIGPSSGLVGVASGNFTVMPNGLYTGTVTVTPSGGGLSTPVVLTFSNSYVSQTFTITPTVVGTVTLTPTNSGGLSNPTALSYQVVTATRFTLTGPSSGLAGMTSGKFSVTPDAAYTGHITITPSGGGLSTPIVLTFSNSGATQTFVITPTVIGVVTLIPSNDGGLINPPALSYNSASSRARVIDSVKTTVTAQAIQQKSMDVVWYRDYGAVSSFMTR
jgi:hypothetical protein